MPIKFKFKYDGSRRIAEAYKKAIIESVSKKAFTEIGAFVSDLIYKRTKSGKGLDAQKRGANIKKLDNLSTPYIEYRKYGKVSFLTKDKELVVFFVKPPKGGDFFKPERSNLTLTGQMLDALDYASTSKEVKIFVKPSPRKGSDLNNAEVAKHVQDNGRPFLELSEKEVKQVQARLVRIIRENIRKLK